MKRMFLTGLVAGLCCLGISSAASATTVDLVWSSVSVDFGTVEVDGNSVTIEPGATATLTLDVYLDTYSPWPHKGLTAYFLFFDWDTDLDDELDWVSGSQPHVAGPTPYQLIGDDEFTPLGTWGFESGNPPYGLQESTGAQKGITGQLEAYCNDFVSSGLCDVSGHPVQVLIGTMTFVTNPGNVQNDGNDIFSGTDWPSPGPGTGIYSADYYNITNESLFGGASVNVFVPTNTPTSTPTATPTEAPDTSIPTPLAPSGEISDTTPTFSWTAVTGASKYHLAVYDKTAGSYVILRTVTGATSYTPSSPLDNTRDYKWKVRAYAGGWGAFSGWMAFEYGIGVPTPQDPSGTIIDTTPTFSWTAVASASKYFLAVYDKTAGSYVILRTVTGATSYTPSSPLDNTRDYKWKVRAYADGWGAYCGWMAFKYGIGVATPQDPSGMISDATPTFSWTAVAGASKYHLAVYDKTAGSYVILRTVAGATTYTPATALTGTAYKWKVRAYAGGWGAFSGWMWFSYGAGFPAPIAPAGTIADTTPVFYWTPVVGASKYHLAAYDTTAGSYTFLKVLSGVTSYTPAIPLDNTHGYKWKVAAYAGGWGAFSGWRHFGY